MNIIVFTVSLLIIHFSFLECAKKKKLDWWQTDVVYQIYPRSFKDSNGDGVGDLKGIYEKLPYLKNLGIGCIWLSPILKSPMVDFGYDVSNFREIDPLFGDMDDFEALVKRAKQLGLKVIMDFVPNHTSDDHEWFQKSVEKVPPYTDYYIWRNPQYSTNGSRAPPNNWLSDFGRSAWEWNEQRGQYYLHQFSSAQPDLNFRNAVVYEEMKNNIIFWLDKGIDGLRIDSVNFLFEHPDFLDEPLSNNPDFLPHEQGSLRHIYTRDQQEDVEMIQEWRKIFDKYSAKGRKRFMITEAYSPVQHMIEYYGNSTHPGADVPFNFVLITSFNKTTNANLLKDLINSWYTKMPAGKWPNWVIGNHDNPRPATRLGLCLIDGLHMLQLLLPGTPFIYNGDELGMEDTYIRFEQSVDPRALIAGPDRYEKTSRDGCRTPFQWDDGKHAGFTTATRPWLPVNTDYWKINVKNELTNNDDSHFRVFTKLIKLRQSIVFQQGDLNIYTLSEWVLAFTRSYSDHTTYAIVINLGSEICTSDLLQYRSSLPQKMAVEVASVNSNYKQGELIPVDAITLRPKASVVLRTVED